MAALLLAVGCSSGPPGGSAAIGSNRTIQPILSENCYACHGPDSGSRKAGLRLDHPEFAYAPHGKFGPAIIPGKPERSPLVKRIEAQDPEERMPPPEAHRNLKPAQIAALRQWIKEGARYEPHWAFIAPQRPAVPMPQQALWARNDIDRFILARLEQERLAPAVEADRRTLIRRVSYDLAGLPPAPEEVATFLADQTPDAYEKLVDRLLASPRYGEQRGRYWLDYARYADTQGLHGDFPRTVWPYRDYVIRSFNENKPFDQFVIEQLAGDLYPATSVDQIVATGFNRVHVVTGEGGSIPEELQFNIVKDRVETVSTVFMGLSMGCAVCHDHKFDPLRKRDFYRLAAFFNNSVDQFYWDEELLAFKVPSPDKVPDFNAVLRERAVVERQLLDHHARVDEKLGAWLADRSAAKPRGVATDRLVAQFPFDEGRGRIVHNRAPGAVPASCEMSGVDPQWGEVTKYWAGLRFSTGTALACPSLGDFERTDAFSVAGWFQPRHVPSEMGNALKGAFISRLRVAADGKRYRGWDLYWDGRPYDEKTKTGGAYKAPIAIHLAHEGPRGEILVRTQREFDRVEWRHLAFTYDGSGRAAGVRLYVNGAPEPLVIVTDRLDGTLRTDAPLQFGKRTDVEPFGEVRFQDVRLYARALDPGELDLLANEDVVHGILARPRRSWSLDDRHAVQALYLARFDPEAAKLRAQLAAFEPRLAALTAGGAPTLVFQEQDSLPYAHVVERGIYGALRERVSPGVPDVLPALPAGASADRLSLARWLVSPQQPLTARVTVNRMWQEIFGTGIVETVENFGVVGARPSHPELLDWLAVDFREHGWDVKRLYRMLVTSATYRQSSRLTPQLLERDPQNRLLARGPRLRLDAEEVRDGALAASGLLVEKIGGPSVKPYQPPGLWEAVSMGGDKYQQDKGAALYRRSLYTYWKRTAPPPVLDTFNAPARDICTVRRERTNTPLQALVTLNAPDFLEASRHLATQALHVGGATDDARLQFMSERVLARPLNPAQLAPLHDSLAAFRARLPRDPNGMHSLLAIGDSPVDRTLPPAELASWMLVANQFFNLDESLNK
jgi:mono/diheme cytochrome c family protein